MTTWDRFCRTFTIAILLIVFVIVIYKLSPNLYTIIINYEVKEKEILQIWLVIKLIFVISIVIFLCLFFNFIYKLLQTFLFGISVKKVNLVIKANTKNIENIEKLEKKLSESEYKINNQINNINKDIISIERRANGTIQKLENFQESITQAVEDLFNWVNLKIEAILNKITSTYPELFAFLQFVIGNQITELGLANKLEKFVYFLCTFLIFIVSILLKAERLTFKKTVIFILIGNLPIWMCINYRLLHDIKFNFFDYGYYITSFIIFLLLLLETIKLKKRGAI